MGSATMVMAEKMPQSTEGAAMRLEGKVAIVTGAAHGMGAETASLFAREGAAVVVADISETEGREVAAGIHEAGGEAMFLRLDVRQEEEWKDAVASTVEKFGKLNVLVNNAGTIEPREMERFFDMDGWEQIMAVNATGTFLGVKHAIPEMKRVGGGSIVNLSSVSGFVGQYFVHPAYSASKGAVRILTKRFAVQYARDGIRVNSVHPGMMPPMRSAQPPDPELWNRALESVPMGRAGRRVDVAYAVLFLASDEASYITGTELVVDGGYLAV
jgi:NAD(P)-dependent dehydrogenase (short-subunit alcohol dehydrogenase family)